MGLLDRIIKTIEPSPFDPVAQDLLKSLDDPKPKKDQMLAALEELDDLTQQAVTRPTSKNAAQVRYEKCVAIAKSTLPTNAKPHVIEAKAQTFMALTGDEIAQSYFKLGLHIPKFSLPDPPTIMGCILKYLGMEDD